MATQLDPPQPDIDRTDELPQLDVAAYEASLAANPTIVRANLERTQLRAARPQAEPTISRGPSAAAAPSPSGADRDGQAKVIAGLKAENARLSELRSIADEMVKRLEQKVRDQSVQFTAQLTELQSSRFDEHIKGEKGRDELHEQVAQKSVQLSALQEQHAKLTEELQATTELATERAATISELKALLVDEETGAEQLALQLASKLRDYDALKAQLTARDHAIAELRSRTNEVSSHSQQSDQAVAQLSAQLETANGELAQLRAQLNARADELAESRRQFAQSLAEQTRQVNELRAALQAAQANAAAADRDLAAARSVLSDEQSRRHAVEEQLRAEGLNAEGLRAGLDFARAQLQELSNERDSLLSLRGEAAEKASALERAEELLSEAQRDIATLHGELGSQAEHARDRDAELAAAHAAASELRRERGVMQQGLEHAWQVTEALQEEIRTNSGILQAKVAELAAAKQELTRQGPAVSDLERSLRARDELCNQLRQQLQSSQDEHGIMAGQLNKVRLRVRSLADQIFQRDNQIAALKTELATHVEALAAIRRDVDRIEEAPSNDVRIETQRVLLPVEHEGEPILLDRPVINIGRTTDNDVCIPSKLISRRHARLLVSASGVVVEDAGSTNGCFVNGIEVTQRLMQDGDVLEIGDLRFRLCTPSASTQARDNVIAFSGQKS
jgi:DNA repair exonuclease SbcCD ATPase subunit